jgi:hypothetical protein
MSSDMMYQAHPNTPPVRSVKSWRVGGDDMTRYLPKHVLSAVAVLTCLGGCADKVQLPISRPRASTYPIIVRLVSRSDEITITAGPDGPLYTGTLSDGTHSFANLSLEDLRNQQPAIYRQVHPAMSADTPATALKE